MESLKRGHHLISSSDEVEKEEDRKRPCLVLIDPLERIPSQVFVQVLLDSQLDLSTTAWMLVRVSRRWKEAIESSLRKRWRAVDVYHPFLWASDPGERSGLFPPMVPLLDEWGRRGWLGLLQWAHGLGFPLLHRDDQDQWGGRHTLLEAACLGGHHPVVAWVLDDLGGYLDEGKAIEGACRSGDDALLRWLVEERHVDPFRLIPSDENPASRGNLEMCQWLAEHCRNHFWLSGAGRNDHRHILEWAISEGHAVDWLVWPECYCVWLTVPRAHHRPRVRQRQGGWTRWRGCGGDWAAIRQPVSGSMPSGWLPRLASGQRWSGCSTGVANATGITLIGPPGVDTSMWWPSCGSVLASMSHSTLYCP